MIGTPAMARFFCALLLLVASTLGIAQMDPRDTKVYRIASVSPTTPTPLLDVFRQALRERGYVEGKNLVIDAYYAEGRPDRLAELMVEAIAKKPDVLFTGSTVATLAAKKATTTVPIVFASLFDPMATGVVASLERPGGNVTGAALDVGRGDLYGKWVQLLKETNPGLGHIAVLTAPAGPLRAQQLQEVQTAARTLNVKVDVVSAGNAADLDTALAAIGASNARAMIVMPDPFFTPNREKLARFAASQRLPTMYFFKIFADAGGLMAYGASQEDSFNKAAALVDRVLKGANPGDLAVQVPARPELIINLKAAKQIGLTIPPSMLQRADRVID